MLDLKNETHSGLLEGLLPPTCYKLSGELLILGGMAQRCLDFLVENPAEHQ